MADEAMTFTVEDAQIVFRNFAGEANQYNKAGDRNFCVLLDEKTATRMAKDGWNIKGLKSREEGEPDQPYIQVSVGYKAFPPSVTVLTDSSRTRLDENSIATLDWAEIRTVDLIARAYNWEVNGKTGVKAYLKTMFVTIEEDILERKYADRGQG